MKSYFSHDDNAFSDLKIIQLCAKFGLEAYGFWWVLIERFRIEKNYKLEYKNTIFSAFIILLDCSIP